MSVLAGSALALALNGCPEPDFTVASAERVCTLHLHMNDGSPARPGEELFVRVVRPETGIGTLPEAPTREGHRFGAWNTAADGSGESVAANTPVCLMANFVVLYAQWEKRLHLELSTDTLSFSPINLLATIELVVSGFSNPADAAGVEVEGEELAEWLRVEKGSYELSEGSKTLGVHVHHAGTTFNEPTASIRLGLKNIPKGYYAEQTTLHVQVEDGTQERRISVRPGNMEAFNAYANTTEGLKSHYQLVGNVVLKPPVPPETSNWKPIGRYISGADEPFAEAFTGSFDGGGHTIADLVIHRPENYQGFFGVLASGALIENLGLIGGSVTADNYVGGLVGHSYQSRVHNSYATGDVRGNNQVGGLAGRINGSTVHSSYARGNVSGEWHSGGLVGLIDNSTVQNSYATGNVSGEWHSGGLVGLIDNGTVQNSYATGNVHGFDRVGGLVGHSAQGKVENNYATGDVSGDWNIGGLLGFNDGGTVQNNYATGNVRAYSQLGGLVGYTPDGGTLRNCVALNASVLQSYTYDNDLLGRIGGNPGSRANNHARNNMRIRYGVEPNGTGGTDKTTTSNATGVDGQNVSAGTAANQYNNVAFWMGVFENFDNNWQWNPSTELPVLQNVGGQQAHTVKPLP